MKTNDYTDANRSAWNEAAPFHEQGREFRDIASRIGNADFSCLDEVQIEWLTDIGVSGKDIVQLCCNNGRELLSIERLGAASCVGFDISGAFITQARYLAETGGLSCRFVESDVYRIPGEFDHQFDLCVITIGVLGWMPDLGRFFDVVHRLLRPGGKLFIHEEHPIVNMLEPYAENPFHMVNSYFRAEPFVETDIIVYDGTQPGSAAPHYWFVHTLSSVISNCLNSGFTLERFCEYENNISSDEYDVYEGREAQLPLSYAMLAARK